MFPVISRLMEDGDPAVRYKLLVNVLQVPPDSPDAKEMRERIRCAPVVQCLLSERDENGDPPYHPYKKWTGAHWLLSILADLNYPAGDESLIRLREQEYEWLLPNQGRRIPYREKIVLQGRVRTCASQEGNAVYSLLALGLADERTDLLVKGLLDWQWPDGGWNCDPKPDASHSSFHESLIPLRALILYAKITGNPDAKQAAEDAADIFLKRHMFLRQSNGEIMSPAFLQLGYPCYWQYDILFGLKVMAEGGWLGDERCREALDILESKQLPDGGFRAEKALYKVPKEGTERRGHTRRWTESGLGKSLPSSTSLVDWGGVSLTDSNPWVTADALGVLARAGRI